MHLSADEVYVEPKEDDYPFTVGFRDNAADYCLVLTRFSDMEPDDGTISVMVRDQIHARSTNLAVDLTRSQCRVRLDEETAKQLLGVHEYIVDFQVDESAYGQIVEFLKTIFQGLPGLTIDDGSDHRASATIS